MFDENANYKSAGTEAAVMGDPRLGVFALHT